MNLILLKVEISFYTLELTHTEIPRDQDLQSTVVVDRSYLPPDTKVTDIEISPFGANFQQQIAREHLAQSAIKTHLGVPAIWETGVKPPIKWSTWLGTLKMAIMARDDLQVNKLLTLKHQEQNYPTQHSQLTKNHLTGKKRTKKDKETGEKNAEKWIEKMNVND